MHGSVRFRKAWVELPGGGTILEELNLSIAPGEAVAFVGRSGAGKTTALRLINGLVRPSRGEVLVDGELHDDRALPLLRRRIGYIIQGSGLFPHRSVLDNITTVPRLLAWDPERMLAAAFRVMDAVQLPPSHYAGRYPGTLSGGEQQRVGIARAIIFSPSILLCDEPFGALDPLVRRELQELFLSIRRSTESTLVFVTHDLGEAMTVADRLVHFESGRVAADVPAAEYANHPDPVVQQFVNVARSSPGLRL
jgi:osmoprotectant transport system ATP-binding protein